MSACDVSMPSGIAPLVLSRKGGYVFVLLVSLSRLLSVYQQDYLQSNERICMTPFPEVCIGPKNISLILGDDPDPKSYTDTAGIGSRDKLLQRMFLWRQWPRVARRRFAVPDSLSSFICFSQAVVFGRVGLFVYLSVSKIIYSAMSGFAWNAHQMCVSGQGTISYILEIIRIEIRIADADYDLDCWSDL